MLGMINAYKRFPYPVIRRVKFFNTFRYLFTLPLAERFLVKRLAGREQSWWRRLIPPFYFYPPGSLRNVERHGIRYALDISRLLDHSTYYFSMNDPSWRNLFTILKNDFTIIDAGANFGYLSLNFAKRCHKGFVYSFEPDSKNFSDVSRNVELNAFKNIKLYQLGLGSTPGNFTLYSLYDANPGANRILREAPKNGSRSESIHVTTLDLMMDEGHFRKIDLIKIDVEGFELFVIQGGQKMIRLWKPILFVELAEVNLKMQNCTALQLVDFIELQDYDVFDAKSMTAIDKSNLTYTDILCFPRSKS